jgi:hypothetical protein
MNIAATLCLILITTCIVAVVSLSLFVTVSTHPEILKGEWKPVEGPVDPVKQDFEIMKKAVNLLRMNTPEISAEKARKLEEVYVKSKPIFVFFMQDDCMECGKYYADWHALHKIIPVLGVDIEIIKVNTNQDIVDEDKKTLSNIVGVKDTPQFGLVLSSDWSTFEKCESNGFDEWIKWLASRVPPEFIMQSPPGQDAASVSQAQPQQQAQAPHPQAPQLST